MYMTGGYAIQSTLYCAEKCKKDCRILHKEENVGRVILKIAFKNMWWWWLRFGLKLFMTNPNYTFCVTIMLALKMVIFNLYSFVLHRTLNTLNCLLHECLSGSTSFEDHELKRQHTLSH
jgi:hypothetical protein